MVALMKRFGWASAFLLVLGLPTEAFAAEFDPALNGLRIAGDTIRTYDFERADGLIGAELATWATDQGYPKLVRTKIERADQIVDRLTDAADAIEGAHALRLGGDKGLVIADESLFAPVKEGRFEASLWARADGAAPVLHVVYDDDPANIYGGQSQFAAVRAIRTGRETSDGWAEYSTGPVDGSVWGIPVRALVVLPPLTFGPAPKTSTTFLVDALEIRAVAGRPVAPNACTQANVDAVCGPEGDCMFGHCVSSSVTWGANPPAAHRSEIAERWIQFATRFIGDRNAVKIGRTVLTPEARELAKTAPSSRQFFGGLSRLVNMLRDNHTSFGMPSNFTSFAPQIQQGSSSAMGACFGIVEKDIMGGGLGFAVFHATTLPRTGIPLKTGDVLTAIDGVDPKAWVDENWPRFATTLPNDPRSDWGAVAADLSSLITTRASTVVLERCESSASCEPAARTKLTIDIGDVVFKILTGASNASEDQTRFTCSPRFTDTVAIDDAGGSSSSTQEDTIYVGKGEGGETRVQFDGFVGTSDWEQSMKNVFSSGAPHVLMDARMGHGGYVTAVEYLFHLLRGTSDPIGVFTVGRGSYDLTDPPWLFTTFSSCVGDSSDQLTCYGGNANGFFATEPTPVGGATKIAWLNTHDVSANDFTPRLLKGRAGFRIFAPHPTSGAFGAILDMPSVASGWLGASLQIQDARFVPSIDTVGEARWESGHGVEPDEIVAQKLSDAIAGVDTIVKAATAWLTSP